LSVLQVAFLKTDYAKWEKNGAMMVNNSFLSLEDIFLDKK
jgi:hypothetical protein